jgi:hypothetical protein
MTRAALLLVLLLSGPVLAQDKPAQAKDAVAKAQKALDGAQRDMLATREGQRYLEVLAALQALQAFLAPPPPVATKIEPPQK